MGQSHSSAAGGNSGAPAADNVTRKTDYYELLGIGRTATDEEYATSSNLFMIMLYLMHSVSRWDQHAAKIKKAYKKKALEHHPDRNYGNVEASTAIFAQIQGAYEVLSDPQERAWYDSHRDAILAGHDGPTAAQYSHDIKMTTAEDITRLIMKFNPRMDFSDAPSGFFGGLRETFETLAREEELACQWDGLEPVDYPSFGHKDDGYDSIRLFYSIWSGFATKKSFSWKDIYRYSEAPDRRVRRLMEKENRRLRDEGIREFNDAVRSLVAFVKKRDPRFKATVQSEEERQKSLRDAAAAQAARSRAANEAKLQGHQVPEWARSEEVEEDMFSGSSESEIEQDYFECVVCRKIFKSEKQFDAHERSKKHIKAVKQLRWEMRTEDKHIQQLSTGMETETGVSTSSSIQNSAKTLSSTATSAQANAEPISPDTEDELEDIVEPAHENDVDDLSDHPRIPESNISEAEPQTRTQEPEEAEDYTNASDTDQDYAPRAVLLKRFATDTTSATNTAHYNNLNDLTEDVSKTSINDNDDDDDEPTQPKLGKAKLKRAKRAATAAAAAEDEGKKGKTFTCATCKSSFTSNTKLFNHIKVLNHAQSVAAIKPNNKQPGRAVGKKGAKR
ncbi:meiotically up-regulated gene 185 protein [Histoplasma capsulatum]|uniref:Meiotically up-regulated gene 185 protein n=1 Tax=Ajellomyces capsulatus TaxID=5037 RepID=A0A8A1M5J9_AJECA|nr:meiotically up-regulated gene 185 protein [Histoplasma capsulatum]